MPDEPTPTSRAREDEDVYVVDTRKQRRRSSPAPAAAAPPRPRGPQPRPSPQPGSRAAAAPDQKDEGYVVDTREQGRRGSTSDPTASPSGPRTKRTRLRKGRLALLVGAGLLIRSFDRLTQVDLGFQPAGVLTYSVTFPSAQFRDAGQLPPLYQAVLERVRALPSVRAVGVSADLPMNEPSDLAFEVEGRAPRSMRPNAPPEDVQPFAVTADYFNTLRIPLRRGRLLLPTDGPTAPRVTVINEQMARQAFPGEDPIGKRITLGDAADASSWMTIVGVVGNIAQVGVTAKPYSQLYASILQSPSRIVYVSLRTDGAPDRLVPAVRRTMREVAPDLVVNDVATLESLVARDIARPRLSVWLLTGFSGIALLLAAVGIYGVMAYTVAQRTREIGVRMALGAGPFSVERLVVWQGMRPALIGVAVGLAGAFATSRLIASLLYGVSALDPVTFALVPLFLATIALLATYLPARRATRVSPTVALQSE